MIVAILVLSFASPSLAAAPLERCRGESYSALAKAVTSLRKEAEAQSKTIAPGHVADCAAGKPSSQDRAAELNRKLSGLQSKLDKAKDAEKNQECRKDLESAMQENEKALRALYEKSETQSCR